MSERKKYRVDIRAGEGDSINVFAKDEEEAEAIAEKQIKYRGYQESPSWDIVGIYEE